MSIQIYGLFANLIIYILFIFPIMILAFNKRNYISKNNLINSLLKITIIETILSIILYKFSRNIFSSFIKTSGIVNFAVYASKILFITSSLYGIKFIIPMYLKFNNQKKATIIFISKIVANIIFIFIGYTLFSTKGLLFSFPLCDFIYYIIYLYSFIKI